MFVWHGNNTQLSLGNNKHHAEVENNTIRHHMIYDITEIWELKR